MANLDSAVSALVKRLESVTSRLEAVEKQIASGAHASAPAAAGGGGDGGDSQSVREYGDLIASYITPLVAVTNKIGSDELKKQVDLLNKATAAQKSFLEVVAASKKPAPDAIGNLVGATSKLMGEISELREKKSKERSIQPPLRHLRRNQRSRMGDG
jgi:hypothetical protein